MLAQTTDSGGNNGPMAAELQSMFANAEQPATWAARSHHVKCYAHKLNLVVGHGLKALGQKVNYYKPTIPHGPHGIPLPVPALAVNDGEDEVEIDKSDSEEEEEDGLPDTPYGVDEDDGDSGDGPDAASITDDNVAEALKKVCTSNYLSS